MSTPTTPIVGKLRQNRQMRDLSAGDPWSESPFYGCGEIEHEHINSWPAGTTIAGIFKGLRTANKSKAKSEQREYAVFETDDGEKFRAYTPGQLKYQLGLLEVGTYVEMTYVGKEYVESAGQDLHQFKTLAEEGSVN